MEQKSIVEKKDGKMEKIHICNICGKVMKEPEDFAGSVIGNKFCCDCTDEFGYPKLYSKIINKTKKELVEIMNISENEAEKMAKENISKKPYWLKRGEIMQFKDKIVITDVGSTTTKALLLKKVNSDFKITAIADTPTTVEKPFENVNIGVFNSLEKLQKETNCKLLKPNSDNNNLDFCDDIFYLTTSSAGGGLQILVIGLTMFDSASSGKRTAYGAGGVILDTFAIDDKRSSLEQMTTMKILHPEL